MDSSSITYRERRRSSHPGPRGRAVARRPSPLALWCCLAIFAPAAAGGGLGHFAVANWPELIGLLQGFREAGVDVLSTGRQAGIIGAGVALVQRGTDIAISPLA